MVFYQEIGLTDTKILTILYILRTQVGTETLTEIGQVGFGEQVMLAAQHRIQMEQRFHQKPHNKIGLYNGNKI